MGKPDRLLMMLNLLSSRQRMSVAELAEACAVSERTVYRDVLGLARANYPIYYDRGYRLLHGENLPPFNLTPPEYAVLKTILDGWPLAGLEPYRKVMRGLAAKAERYYRLAAPRREPTRAQRLVLRGKTTTAGHQRMQLVMSILLSACEHLKVVEFDYTNLDGQSSRRGVDPYFVVFRGRAFYLVGRCHRRRAMRLFRLERIGRLEVTDRRFVRDPEVTPESVFAFSWDVYPGPPNTVRVRLRGRARVVVESGLHHPTEKITRHGPDAVVYEAKVSSLEEFGRWVLGFGGEAEVLAPPELKAWVLRSAEGALTANRRGA